MTAYGQTSLADKRFRALFKPYQTPAKKKAKENHEYVIFALVCHRVRRAATVSKDSTANMGANMSARRKARARHHLSQEYRRSRLGQLA